MCWKQFLYLLSGTVFISAPESILTGSGLHPCFVTICNVVWKAVCPSDAMSAGRLNTVRELDDLWVRWLIWHAGGDESLWLRAGCGLVKVSCFLGVLTLPSKMFINCVEAMLIVLSCIGKHCTNG